MKKGSDCTEILVGKNATIDGSTIVARNEDGYGPINPIKFIVHEAKDQTQATYTSVTTGVTVLTRSRLSLYGHTTSGSKRWPI
ncbi:dipeptidase [Lactobacillus plantarum JDM1] [Lactiplantibacillus mudanjiangensis]|nr:dipeptidase [Lactobacillus plantarum JDM1] [Lactiplantibacillus mudanjiangensis]